MIAGVTILTPDFPKRHAKADVQDALRRIPGGVGLVTGSTGAGFFATTAVSIAPLSADPPTLILCLDNGGGPAERDDIGGLRRIGVSILGAQHRGLAEGFGGRRVPARTGGCGIAWRSLAQGAAVIEDAVLAFDCRVLEVIERCGQAILIAEIEAMRVGGEASVLVYWRGEYDRIGWTEAEISCATGSRG